MKLPGILLVHLGLSFAGLSLHGIGPSAALAADSLLTSSNLPIIIINTNGQTIPDEPKITADMGIIDNGPGMRNVPGDAFNGYNGKIGIEIRGSSSQMFPKKQYGIELRDTLGNSVDVPLLGLPAENDWVLSAEYSDKSLIRSALLFQLARSTGRYASRARYCEVILNGDYVGVYVLLEKVKRGKNRVNISKMGAADTTGDALTGGYIVKVDKIEGADTQGWYSMFPSVPGIQTRIYYQYDYPKAEDLTPHQKQYIQDKIKSFETVAFSWDATDTAIGYPHYVDVSSAVDILLLNELSKNVDSYRLSAFMHKDKDSKGGKFVFGPVWDYNLGFGNCNFYDASNILGFQMDYFVTSYYFLHVDTFLMPFWWKTMFDDPAFRVAAQKRWNELRQKQFSLASINACVDSLASILQEGQTRNFLRWPILGTYVWPNVYVGPTYQSELTYLKNWIASRIEWLDGQFPVTSVDETGGVTPTEFALAQNYPNPFNPTTTIRYTVGGVVALSGALSNGVEGRYSHHITLAVYDLLGREVAVLVNEKNVPGSYQIRFDGTGLASGVYFYRLQTNYSVSIKRMVLMR